MTRKRERNNYNDQYVIFGQDCRIGGNMIETIYNKEPENEENIKLPKNIHQIGPGESKTHIYIEDKISEFMELYPENEKDIRYGVLLGNVKYSKGELYSFVNGIVDVRDIIENTILFGDDIWTGIYEDIKKYYSGRKIIGWYASVNEFNEKDMFYMRKIHLDHFAGNEKIFILFNREEEEKSLYCYRMGELERILSYHIYYEKNQEIQRYICETHYNLVSKTKSTNIKAQSLPRNEKAEKAEKTEKQEETVIKEMPKKNVSKRWVAFSGKAASLFVISACVFTVGVMYKQGQLENLSTEMKAVVAGIMNTADETDMDDIVILDSKNNIIEETSAVEETTIEEDLTEETIEETTTVEEKTEQNTTEPESGTASILPATTQYYTVEKGDTLYGICKKLYGNSNNVEMIMKLNDLDSADSIYYGKTLIVP